MDKVVDAINGVVTFVETAIKKAADFALSHRLWFLGALGAGLHFAGYFGLSDPQANALVHQSAVFIDAGQAWLAATLVLVHEGGGLLVMGIAAGMTVYSYMKRPLTPVFK